jgi:hypothetical protein
MDDEEEHEAWSSIDKVIDALVLCVAASPSLIALVDSLSKSGIRPVRIDGKQRKLPLFALCNTLGAPLPKVAIGFAAPTQNADDIYEQVG